MTASQPSAHQHAVKAYTARLGTRITAGVGTRLWQLALIRRQRINHLLDELLDAAPPGTAELAARMAHLAHDSDTTGEGNDR